MSTLSYAGKLTPLLVEFRTEDAPALLELSEGIGWPHEIGDWQTALAASTIFGHRDADGRALSTSAIYKFGPELAALAMVLVREDIRRRGLARAAVIRCLEHSGDSPVLLVATPYGEPLYAILGFRTVEQVVRMVAPQGTTFEANGDCVPITDADFPRLLNLDRDAYGADRSRVLRRRWGHAQGGLMLPDGTGFAWKTLQRGVLVIGPVIARDAAAAVQLIRELSAGFPGRIKVEVPEQHAELILGLKAGGFGIDSTRALMLKNAETLPGRRDRMFGLASLGYG